MYRSSLIVLFAAGIMLVSSCSNEGSTDTAVLRVPVTIEEVTTGDIASYNSQTGTIIPIEEMEITAEVGGELHYESYRNRSLRSGDPVIEGQLIARISNDEYLLGVALESKAMALEHANRDFEDKKKLDALGGATQREVENAERALLNAQNSHKTAIINAEKVNIKSPISGIFTEERSVVDGQKISAGRVVGKVLRYDKVKCQVNITADDYQNIWTGQEVVVTNISQNEEIYAGVVSKVSPTIDPVTRTFQVEIEIDNPELRLKSGSFVKVDIVVEKKYNVIKIPKHIITTQGGKDVVFVVEEQTAKMKPVVIGLEDSEFAEIIQGLTAGELLIVRGYEALKNNTKVRISR